MKPRRKPELQIIGSGTKKRLTLTIPASLYTAIEPIAADQHRDLHQQCVYMLETAVKQAQGRERERQRREAGRRWSREVEDLIRGDT